MAQENADQLTQSCQENVSRCRRLMIASSITMKSPSLVHNLAAHLPLLGLVAAIDCSFSYRVLARKPGTTNCNRCRPTKCETATGYDIQAG